MLQIPPGAPPGDPAQAPSQQLSFSELYLFPHTPTTPKSAAIASAHAVLLFLHTALAEQFPSSQPYRSDEKSVQTPSPPLEN